MTTEELVFIEVSSADDLIFLLEANSQNWQELKLSPKKLKNFKLPPNHCLLQINRRTFLFHPNTEEIKIIAEIMKGG